MFTPLTFTAFMYNINMKRESLSQESYEKICKAENTPVHVICHCRCVSNVAVLIAKALIKEGFDLDLVLLRNSCLLHDISRAKPDHAERGYELLVKLGYLDEAAIVREHMRHNPSSSCEDFTELDIVCIADRLVLEDCFVGLEERMAYVLEKSKDNLEAIRIIRNKKAELKIVLKKIEEKVGKTIEEIILEGE